MRAEDRLGGEIVDGVLRVVLDHRDLLEDDLTLGVDVHERRRKDHVGHDVEGDVDVVVGDAGVDDRCLTRGGRVQLASHCVEQLGDLDGTVALRPLEQEMLDEVRDTRARRRLVARAGSDPETDRGRADAVDVLGDDPLPARQRRESVLMHGVILRVADRGRRQPSGAERTRPRRGPRRCRRSRSSRRGGSIASTGVRAAWCDRGEAPERRSHPLPVRSVDLRVPVGQQDRRVRIGPRLVQRPRRWARRR